MRIVALKPNNEQSIKQAAALLIEGFKIQSPDSWPTTTVALEEVKESLQPDRISRIAVDDKGTVLGWIGGISRYHGHVWELHPLVVKTDYQRKGIGRALVTDLEECVQQRGGLTVWLGTDDEINMTTLGGIDLYPDVLGHVARIENLRDHPFEFYQKLGFVIVGVMPDANGLGKPDIFMAKRLGGLSS